MIPTGVIYMNTVQAADLKLYSNVKEIPVDWLWYPYIPYGKLTLLQGDPGGGKSMFMINLIAAFSNGGKMPDGHRIKRPMHVIYQCSEDNAADTIKPRLLAAGADCDNVAFIDEELETITLTDEVLRRAIADFNAKLLVIDPFQAYLGDADISNVTSIRKVLKQLAFWAAAYDCAIVLIGHLNKKQGSKDIYRGLGSIDLMAAARSVLQIERSEENPEYRMVRHIKSSLAPHGGDFGFQIDENTVVQWFPPDTRGEHADDPEPPMLTPKQEKQEQICFLLKTILGNGPVRATDIRELTQQQGVSERTLLQTKSVMDIGSFKQGRVWYWTLKKKE